MLVLSVKTLFITMGIWFGNPWFLGFVLFVTLLLYITLNDIIHSFIQILTILYTSSYVTCLQLNPEILCLDIGLCSSNGFHRMKYKFSNFPNLDSFETHSYVSVLLTKVFFFLPAVILLKLWCIMKVGMDHQSGRAPFVLSATWLSCGSKFSLSKAI